MSKFSLPLFSCGGPDDSIEMDMNNRKSETRAEQKLFDLQIEVCEPFYLAERSCILGTDSVGDQQQIHYSSWGSANRNRIGQMGISPSSYVQVLLPGYSTSS